MVRELWFVADGLIITLLIWNGILLLLWRDTLTGAMASIAAVAAASHSRVRRHSSNAMLLKWWTAAFAVCFVATGVILLFELRKQDDAARDHHGAV